MVSLLWMMNGVIMGKLLNSLAFQFPKHSRSNNMAYCRMFLAMICYLDLSHGSTWNISNCLCEYLTDILHLPYSNPGFHFFQDTPPMLCWFRVGSHHCLLFVWEMLWVFLPPVSLHVWNALIIAHPPNRLPVKILPSEMASLPLKLLSLRLIFPFSCTSTSHFCESLLLCAVFYHAFSFSTSTLSLTLFSPHFSKLHLFLKTPFKCYVFISVHIFWSSEENAMSPSFKI